MTRPDQDAGREVELHELPLRECEPAGHSLGRFRGALTTEIHTAVDGRRPPVSVRAQRWPTLRGRNAGERARRNCEASPRLPGRRRSSPTGLTLTGSPEDIAWKQIAAVIPQKRGDIVARKRRGRAGADRLPLMMSAANSAILSNGHSRYSSNGVNWPPATTRLPSPLEPQSYSGLHHLDTPHMRHALAVAVMARRSAL